MRKFLAPAAVTLSLAFAGAMVGQSTASTAPGGMTQEKTTEKKVKDPNGPDTKSKTTSVIGTVKEYEAGKSIKVATSKHHTKSFDLNAKDTTATVDPAVAVGSKVKVTDAKDPNGNHTITVSPYEGKSTSTRHHMKKATKTETTTSPAPANP